MLIKSNIKISSNRNFGLVFFFIFLVVSIWPLTHNESPRIWSAIISLAFLILVLTRSKLLTPLNRLWAKFGIILGSIIAPIVMGVVFFLVVTPIGLFMKIIGKDLLSIKYDKKKETYWVKRDKPTSTMKQQF
jgi:hypothetical protein